jgi:hypothetical protein
MVRDARGHARAAGAVALALALGAGTAATGGCSRDIFDVTVALQTETYRADFGAQQGTIPAIPCAPGGVDVCSRSAVLGVDTSVAGAPTTVDLQVVCDDASRLCAVDADARIAYTVDVLQDASFTDAVARQATSLVRVADIAYTVPTNTLTFDVPKVDIFVGPAGSTLETDPGVVPVGSTDPLPAGTTLTTPGHITVADGAPARAVIEGAIKQRLPFTFVVVLSPRITSGDPIPAGAIEVDVVPHLLIGLP